MSAGKKRGAPHKDRPKRLVVEGVDDQWSIINLIQRHGLCFDDAPMPFVYDSGGVTNLLTDLSSAARNFPHLGIVLDADLDVGGRWQAVRDRLVELGIEVPATPSPQGFIARGFLDDYRIGVWLMPDNLASGMLEDFLGRLIPSGDPTWSLACDSTTQARALGAPLSLLHQSKGALHTWLAWRETSGVPFGTAINAKYLLSDTPEALAFLAWFRTLFEV